jgi:hypothetical protein
MGPLGVVGTRRRRCRLPARPLLAGGSVAAAAAADAAAAAGGSTVGWGRVSAYCVLFATMCHCKAIWQYTRWARSGWGTHITAACNRLQPAATGCNRLLLLPQVPPVCWQSGVPALTAAAIAAPGSSPLLCLWLCRCTAIGAAPAAAAADAAAALPLPLAAASAASGVVMLDGL